MLTLHIEDFDGLLHISGHDTGQWGTVPGYAQLAVQGWRGMNGYQGEGYVEARREIESCPPDLVMVLMMDWKSCSRGAALFPGTNS